MRETSYFSATNKPIFIKVDYLMWQRAHKMVLRFWKLLEIL